MLAVTSCDKSRFRAKIAKLTANEPTCTREALKVMGALITDHLESNAPEDTSRYIRGWQQASVQAGCGPRMLRPLNPSSRRQKFLDSLAAQVRYFDGVVAHYERIMEDWYIKPNRKRKGYWHKLVRRRDKAAWRRNRALQELEKYMAHEHALFFDAGAYAERKNSRQLSTVRTKIYGGTGRILVGTHGAILQLHNLEPHSTIVEKWLKPMAKASKAVLQFGAKRVGQTYLKELLNGTGIPLKPAV